MSLYEGMFLLDNRQANRDWDGTLDGLKAIVTKHGGEILRCEKWGERKLAYEILGRRRGTYVLIYFEAKSDAVTRIYREVELNETLLRALVLKIKELPPEEVAAPKPAVADGEAKTPAPEAQDEAASDEAEAETDAAPEAETEVEKADESVTEGA